MTKKTKKPLAPRAHRLLLARVAKLEKTRIDVADQLTSKLMTQLASLRHDVDVLLVSRRDNAVAVQQANRVLGDRVAQLEVRVHAAELVDGPTWKTADGTLLRMKEMTDSHLGNAICFLERAFEKREGQPDTLFSRNWKATYQPKLNELRAEKKRRETMAAAAAKWEHTLPPGRYTFRMEPTSETRVSYPNIAKLRDIVKRREQEQLCGEPFTRVVLDEAPAEQRAKEALDRAESAEAKLAAVRFALMPIFGSTSLDTLDIVRQLVSQRLKGTPQTTVRHQGEKILELQRQLEEEKRTPDDGQLAYWKKLAKTYIDTVTGLRGRIKVLEKERVHLSGPTAKQALTELLEALQGAIDGWVRELAVVDREAGDRIRSRLCSLRGVRSHVRRKLDSLPK